MNEPAGPHNMDHHHLNHSESFENRFKHIIENIDDVIYEIDNKGSVTFISPAIKKIPGMEPEMFLGNTFSKLINADQRFMNERLNQLQKNKVLQGEYKIILPTGGIRWIRLVTKACFNNDIFIGGIGTLTDITELKRQEKQIGHFYRQQKLISEMSQVLINTSNLKAEVQRLLKLTGEYINVSRVYIFEDSTDGFTCSNTYEWCNVAIKPQINELQNISYSDIPSWKKILIKEGLIFSDNIEDLPNDLRNILEPQGIKSLLIFPLNYYGAYRGFIGFDECILHKDWSEGEFFLLRTIANLLSGAFERQLLLKLIEASGT